MIIREAHENALNLYPHLKTEFDGSSEKFIMSGDEKLLKKANADWQVIEKLLSENKLEENEYEGNTYYLRKLPVNKS